MAAYNLNEIPAHRRLRIKLFIAGVIASLQMFMLLMSQIRVPDLIFQYSKLLTIAGFLFICAETIFTLILIFLHKARWPEFLIYLFITLSTLLFFVGYITWDITRRNRMPHPQLDPDTVKTIAPPLRDTLLH